MITHPHLTSRHAFNFLRFMLWKHFPCGLWHGLHIISDTFSWTIIRMLFKMVIISQGHALCRAQRSWGWAAVRWMQHCDLEMVKLKQDGHELQFPFGLGAGKSPCSEFIPQCRYGLRLSRLHPEALPEWAVGVHQMVISKFSPEQPDVLQTWFKSKCAPRLNSPALTWILLTQ